MGTAITRGTTRLVSNRRFEDYKSMKQNFKYSKVKEIIFDGFQTLTNTAANLEPGDLTIALIGAEALVYLSTLADDSNQDLAEMWVTYQDDTGLIHGPILHLLNDDADTSVEACLGNEDVHDVIDTGEGGKTILLTGLAGTLNQYAGLYMTVVAGDQVETSSLIVSNTNATPTVLTISDDQNAN